MIQSYFEMLNLSLNAEATALGEYYKTHKGKLGEAREFLIRRFLSVYLPKKFSVGSGFAIFSHDEGISTQQDIVIYDSLNHAILFPDSGAPLFPPTAIQALIEVKSNLTKEELESTIKKTKQVKTCLRSILSKAEHSSRLPLEPLVLVVAFDSPEIETLKKTFAELSKDIPEQDRLDFICVLNKGLLTGGSYFSVSKFGQPSSQHSHTISNDLANLKTKYPDSIGAYKFANNTLLLLYCWMLSYLLRRETPVFDISLLLPQHQNYGTEV